MRGHGRSQRRPRDVSRTAHVADVLAITKALGLERPVLVSRSLGGPTALLAAAARPNGSLPPSWSRPAPEPPTRACLR
ncbi:alpha/beta fold hydrolase [Kitasatospora sp. NPDC004240]